MPNDEQVCALSVLLDNSSLVIQCEGTGAQIITKKMSYQASIDQFLSAIYSIPPFDSGL